MRKVYLLLALFFVTGLSAQPISEQDALQKAQDFLRGKSIVTSSKASSLRRSASANPYKHLYLFNVEDNDGFVIVAGDSRAREILAYSEKGHLDYSQMPDNLKWWLGLYDEAIAAIPEDMPAPQAETDRRAAKPDVAPMMNFSWKQGSPFNAHCPDNSVVGCVALATAQMMAFYGYPSTLPSLSGYSDNNGHRLESLNSRNINYSSLTADDAAWLSRYAGQALKSSYGAQNTDASGELVASVLINTFGFSRTAHNEYRDAYSSYEWDDLLYNELSNGRPFILSGQNNGDAKVGHTFICHGYSEGYYVVNWGWGGELNGYFAMSALITNGYHYNSDLAACIGIQPTGGSASYKSFSLTKFEVAGYSTTPSSTYDFSISWTIHNSLIEKTDYDLAIAIFKEDNSASILVPYGTVTMLPTNISSSTPNVSISGQYPDGTYKITLIYKKPSEDTWQVCQGFNWRYIRAVISNHNLSLTNFPSSDEPYPTGNPTPYTPIIPDTPDNPDNPDNPDDTRPGVAFEYPVMKTESEEDGAICYVDWNALSNTMFSYLKMNQTTFFDNYYLDCFPDDYETAVPAEDARYVSPYALNNNYDGSYGVNFYSPLLFNFGDDIYGNGGTPPASGEVYPEYDDVVSVAFYPNYGGESNHIISLYIPDYYLADLIQDQTSPITFTRWVRFIAKTANNAAPYRYLWVKIPMEISWSDHPDAINKVETDAKARIVYNLNGQRVNSPQKGIFIINGKKVVIK